MAFLRSGFTTDLAPVLNSEKIFLRMPQISDYSEWAELRACSREFLTPWEPRWARDELSRPAYRQRLRYYVKNFKEGNGYAFFLFRQSDKKLVGGINLSNLRRGVTQSCSIGYWVGKPFSCQGFMTQGLKEIIPFVFDELRLHRIEAACLPNNIASKKLLEKCGFQREGYARSYLCINDTWQDHLLYALLEEDFRDENNYALVSHKAI